MFKVTDLASKDIINVADGRRLGPLKDLEIDAETGKVQALVLRNPEKYLRVFRRGKDVVIPWSRIKTIGLDAILVELPWDGLRQ
ncbi:YlmC/YmxH family sporulation protein [Candidatus Desulforudis audaxviator]|uniref:PRC-barrel domain protein n=1 Tax=Desulforudis audaxviator (strain MP104C) TaxID=477974 RepID=B1I6A9_DESAP|nr:YlmC/YmxH family sporulation protein [Candidatus Desulforudis audaxviator]ACA60576.1 PRC-barrel domain protein [Candidatus Desulforudis audaxviator MP104C]AZK60651.1 hypothetical protein Daudx_2121 [Candidatus Desulforudis audaxviator]